MLVRILSSILSSSVTQIKSFGRWIVLLILSTVLVSCSDPPPEDEIPPNQIRILTQPTGSIPAGSELPIQLEVIDFLGQRVISGLDATAVFSVAMVAGTGVIVGTSTATAVAGVVDFSGTGISLIELGSKTLVLTKARTPLSAPISLSLVAFNIVHGPAASLVYIQQPANLIIASTEIGSIFQIKDAFGNLVNTGPDSIASVTLSLQSGTGPIAGGNTKSAIGGVVDFTGQNVNIATLGMKVLRATKADTSGSGGTVSVFVDSATFEIASPSAHHLTLTTSPLNPTVAGSELSLVVEIQDIVGNAITSGADATANITLTLQSGTGVLAGTVTVAAANGVADFSGSGVNLNLAGSKVVRVTKADTSGSGGTASLFIDTPSFDIINAAADHLTYITQPVDPTVSSAEITTIIEIRDVYENIVTNGSDSTASISTSLLLGSGTLSGTTIFNATAGVIDFTGSLMAVDLVGLKTIRVTKSDMTGSGGTASLQIDSSNFTIIHGPASQVVVTTQPIDPTVAGTTILTGYEIQDAAGNLVSSGADSTASMTLSLQNGTGVLAGTVSTSAVGGVVNFGVGEAINVDLVGAKVLRTTKADTTGSGGTTSLFVDALGFNIIHAPASQLAYTTQPADPTNAYSEISTVIEIQDSFGNIVSTGADATASIALSLQSGTGTLGGTLSMSSVSGIADFTGKGVNLDALGVGKVIRATKADTTGGGGTVSQFVDSSAFTVDGPLCDHITLTTIPTDPTVAGSEISIVAEIRDVTDTLIAIGVDSTTNVTLSLFSGTGTLTGLITVAAIGGIADFTGMAANVDLIGAKVVRVSKEDLTGSGGSGVKTVDTASFNITHAPAFQAVYNVLPADPTISTKEIPIILEVQDSYGNTVSSGADSTANISISIQVGAGTLGGTQTVAAVGGIADFTGSGLNTDTPETGVVLRATKADTTGSGGTASLFVDSSAFNVVWPGASQLVFTTEPTDPTIAGSDLLPVIEIQDASGAVVTSGPDSTVNVTLTLQTGTGTLGGTVTVAAVGGVATFTGIEAVNVDLIGSKNLRATKADTTGSGGTASLFVDSAIFNIIHAPASQLSYSIQPLDPTVVLSNIVSVIEVLDPYGNLVVTGADATANVTLNLQSGSGNLGGTVTIAALAGIAVFTVTETVNIDNVGLGKILRATKADTTGSGGTASAFKDSITFEVIPEAASQLVFTTQPADPTVAGSNLVPVIEIRDSSGFLVSSGPDATANITLNLQVGTGTLGGTLTVAAVGGIATFTATEAININLVGAKTLRATKADTSGSGGTVSFFGDSVSFNITHAAAFQIAYIIQPSNPTVVNNEIPITLAIFDAHGNIVNTGVDSTANITVSMQSGAGTLGGTLTIAAVTGLIDFTGSGLNSDLAEVGVVLRTTKTDTTGGGGTASTFVDSNAFTVIWPAASQMVFTTQPANPTVAGSDLLPVIEIRDAGGNPIVNGPDATANVTLNIQTGTGVLGGALTVAAVNGVATFTATEGANIDLIGAKTLRATKADTSGSGGTASLFVDSTSFNINHAPASQLSFSTEPVSPSAVLADLLPVIEVLDSFGNLVSTGTDATANITLNLQIGTGVLGGTLTLAAVGGVASFTATEGANIDTVGVGKVLRATKADTTGGGGTASVFKDSALFDIVSGSASQLVFTTQPADPTVAGSDLLPVIEIQDASGFVITSGVDATANITLNLQSGTGAIAGTVTVAAVAGVATFTVTEGVNIDLIGAKTVRATKADTSGSGGTTSFFADSVSFNITHSVATQIIYSVQPSDPSIVGAEIPIGLSILDIFGNVVSTGADSTANLTVSMQSGAGTLGGTLSVAAVAGLIDFTGSGLNSDLAEVGVVLRTTKADTTGSGGTASTFVDSNSFTLNWPTASQMVFTTQPVDPTVAGSDLLPTIEIRDAGGNAIVSGPDATANVTLNIQTGTGALGGTLTVAAVNGVATFTATEGANINLIGAKTLRATKADTTGSGGTASLFIDSISFNINHASASQLSFSTEPVSPSAVLADLLPVIEVLDSFGNLVSTGADATANITLNLQTGTGVLGGTLTLSAVGGVASFTATEGANIDTVGVGKVLRATKADTTGSGGTVAVFKDSALFDIVAGAATQLVFTTQPVDPTMAGSDLIPVIEIRDASGFVITSGIDATANITLSLQTGTGVIAGTVTIAAIAGVATFTATEGVNIDLIGAKTVRATKADTSGGGGTASFFTDSASFIITHGPANQIIYTTAPPNPTSINTNIILDLEIQDSFGNIVSSGADASANVTLSLVSGTGSLLGTISKSAALGLISFTATEAVQINATGSSKVIRATKADTTGGGGTASVLVNSITFDVVSANITVAVEQNAGQADPIGVTPVEFDIVFSEAINAATFTIADIVQNGTATGITWSITNSGDDINFTLLATTVSGQGSIQPSVAATTVQTVGLKDNEASSSTDNTVIYTIPGITVSGISGATGEDGTTATFTVVLDGPPNADVVIGISTDDGTEGVPDVASLTFTSANWNISQLVTVTGQSDLLVDGNVIYNIVTAAATSSDGSYNGMDASDVSVTNLDSGLAPGVTVSTISGNTSETGTTATFGISLDTAPTADVVINLSSSDTGEGTIAVASVTFTSANWSATQTITVTGVDDVLEDLDQPYTIITDAAISTDPDYNGMDPFNVTVVNEDDDSIGIAVTALSGNTDETGATATFDIKLKSTPTGDVTIPISSSDTGEGTVSTALLTFTSLNWSTPQVVTVTGLDDALIDGDQVYIIQIGISSSTDPIYNGIDPTDLLTTNIDDDTSGINVSLISNDINETGTTATFSIRLASPPTDNVVIPISSSDTTEGTVDKNSLTFTPANWSTAQLVTVSGVDDAVQDGNQTFFIQTDADGTTTDTNYNNLNPSDVFLTNNDDDSPGIIVTPTAGINVNETGSQATFTMVLGSEPTNDVTITLASSDTGEAVISLASLTFTSLNWASSQTITITGVDDVIQDGTQSLTVTIDAATSTDPVYNGIDPTDVLVNNFDDDTAGFIVTPITAPDFGGYIQTSETGTFQSFSITLSSAPTSDVTINLSSSDTAEGAVSPSSFVFTPLNWNVAQSGSATGVDDAVQDGTVTYEIVTAPAISVDGNYSGLDPSDIYLENLDDDTPGVTVLPDTTKNELYVFESGTSESITVVLNSQPTADVTVSLMSDDTAEGVLSPSSLTFTPDNWNSSQTVIATGVDDAAADGDTKWNVIFSITSADNNYDGLVPIPFDTVRFRTIDDELSDCFVNPDTDKDFRLSTSENAGQVSFQVLLTTQPTADVIVPSISSTDTGEGITATTSLTFTPDNWNAPQTVTITGVDDGVTDGTATYDINFGVSSSTDPSYSGVKCTRVRMQNLDND